VSSYEKHIVKTQERFVRVGGLQVPFTERLTMFNAAVKRKLCEIADQEKKRGEKRGKEASHSSSEGAINKARATGDWLGRFAIESESEYAILNGKKLKEDGRRFAVRALILSGLSELCSSCSAARPP
jgi:hypothetical protein